MSWHNPSIRIWSVIELVRSQEQWGSRDEHNGSDRDDETTYPLKSRLCPS